MPDAVYRDLDFQLGKITGKAGGDWINVKNDSYDIIQSIKNLILTTPGEIPFSDMGLSLYDYKFATLTKIDRELLSSQIYNRLNYEEPRAQINGVTVVQQGSKLLIEINTTLLITPRTDKKITLTLSPI